MKRLFRFHLGMILIAGLWGWIAMFARMFLFQWIMLSVGFQRFGAWSESWGTAKFVLFGYHMSVPFLTFAIDYVLLCILMIPLYMLWSYTRTERTDKYLEAIGGKHVDEHSKV